MIEDEAKTKWCPFANSREVTATAITDMKTGEQVPLAHDRFSQHGGISVRCIGSECMAWRPTDNEIKENPSGPVLDGCAMKASDYVSAGYCGLAGKP